MTNDFTFELPPRGKTRYGAGQYDKATASPKYTIEVSVPLHVRDKVTVAHFLIQTVSGLTWGWEIHNDSTWPAFVIVKRDGVLLT